MWNLEIKYVVKEKLRYSDYDDYDDISSEKIVAEFDTQEEAKDYIRKEKNKAKSKLYRFYKTKGKCLRCPYRGTKTKSRLKELKEKLGKIPECYLEKEYIEKDLFNGFCFTSNCTLNCFNMKQTNFTEPEKEYECGNFENAYEPTSMPNLYIEERLYYQGKYYVLKEEGNNA